MSLDYSEQKRKADQKRQARLRRDLLICAEAGLPHSPTGFVDAQQLYDFANGDDKFDTEGEALTLLRELVAANYLEEKIGTLRKGERFSLRHVRYKLTATGTALLKEHIAPDPMVADERVILE